MVIFDTLEELQDYVSKFHDSVSGPMLSGLIVRLLIYNNVSRDLCKEIFEENDFIQFQKKFYKHLHYCIADIFDKKTAEKIINLVSTDEFREKYDFYENIE